METVDIVKSHPIPQIGHLHFKMQDLNRVARMRQRKKVTNSQETGLHQRFSSCRAGQLALGTGMADQRWCLDCASLLLLETGLFCGHLEFECNSHEKTPASASLICLFIARRLSVDSSISRQQHPHYNQTQNSNSEIHFTQKYPKIPNTNHSHHEAILIWKALPCLVGCGCSG
jgi:hypothetical protein